MTLHPPPRTDPRFGNWLSATYKRLGFTQITLAKAAGVTQTTISHIVTKYTENPSSKVYRKILDILERASQNSGIKEDFREKVGNLPRKTESERLVVQRIGQDVFRQGLIAYWNGCCAISGLAVTELLRASHTKPWADCDDDERLDVVNGFLLSGNFDAAFDQGFITISDRGAVVVSNELDVVARKLLGLDQPQKVRRISDGHRQYLAWHRENVFRAPKKDESPI
jgi:predicted restriction endonuclease